MVRSLVFAGSTTSEFREFLLYFQESLASLHISEMRSAGPKGPSVIGQVRDKKSCFPSGAPAAGWAQAPAEVRNTVLSPSLAVASEYAAAAGPTGHWPQRARLQ